MPEEHAPPAPCALRAWCEARGIDPATLATLVGCSPGTARRWLSGERAPAPRYRVQLHRVTGLDDYRPTPDEAMAASTPSELTAYAQATAEVERSLNALETALQPFTRSAVGAREYLRRTVDPARLARVTNLAQLLMDEEAFSDWLLLDGLFDGGET